MAVNKLDPKIIFASEAPAQDVPAVFTNKTVGWGESRKNGGRPTIKQSNALQQETDLKILWLNENAVTPYDAAIDYPVNAVTLKDGTFKIFNGTSWSNFLDKSSVGLSNVDDTSDLNKPISTAVKTKLDYIDKNGAALPYNPTLTYEGGAVVVKDGVLQQWRGGEWIIVGSQEVKKYLIDAGVDESELDGDYDFLMQRLAQIAVDKGWDASFVVDGDKNQHQINAEIAIKTRYANNIVVTPENFGADTSKADNSSELQDAIDYVVANGGWLDGGSKTYKAANLVIDSGTHIRNIYLENNVFDTNLVSVITTETADALRTPLTNVELINVHIDGKRALLTGMPTGAFSEDGGRHGFRFIRPMQNVVMRGCSANYCGVDGIIIYPIRDIPHAEWKHYVKNVVIENCEFNNNGRHGGSSDSVDGLILRNIRASGNGLDTIVGAPLTSGAAGRKSNGALYGDGWDFEEYLSEAYSINISVEHCVMTGNAGAGAVFVRTGGILQTTRNVIFLGGKYDKGVAGVSIANAAISLSGYLIDFYDWYDITFIDVDFSGAALYVLRSKATLINPKNLLNVTAVDGSTVVSDKDIKVEQDASAVTVAAHLEVKPDGLSQQQVIGISGTTGASSSLLFYDKSANLIRGGITVESGSSVDSTMYLSVQGARRWMIQANGALLPLQDATASIGYINNRVSTIYLATAPVVGSDIKYKKDVESISDVEREVALELKSCIKKYRLIDSDDKHHIGLIAQEVESVFAKHGLNAHDYKLLQYSADSETYALVYEQLMLFIISAM